MATTNHKTRYWRRLILGLLFKGADVLDGHTPLDDWFPAWEHASGGFDPSNGGASISIYVSLHTASPGEAGDQSTNEVAGAFYARQSIYKGTGGWTVNSSDPENPYAENLTGCTWGKNTTGAPIVVTHIGLGRDASGAGFLLASMPLDAPVTIPVGASFAIGGRRIRIFAL